MKKLFLSPLLYLFLSIVIFYIPVLFQGKVPLPADTIVGLYSPYRDFYSQSYPRGVPFKNPLITDPVRQQYPWKYISIESLKKGKLPLWNPYSFSGTPLLANFQAGVFYPLNIIFFILPFVPAWSVFIMLQSLLAGFFMYLYLKNLRLAPQAVFIGSIVFTFCGFSTAWLEWGSIVSTALWLPLILYLQDVLLKKLTWRHILLLLFAEVSMLFAGHLQTYIYAFVVSNVYLFARIYQQSVGQKKRLSHIVHVYAPFTGIGIIFLLITTIQWFPTWRFIQESARSVDQLDKWKELGWFIPWQHLVQFIIPDFFGNPTTGNYWGVWNYGEFIGYIGLIPLLLVITALIWRRDKKILFFGILSFLSLLFATPNILAKIPYLLSIPFLSTTQPTRLLFITDFSFAVLAALGLDYILRNKKKNILSVGLLAILFILVLGSAATVFKQRMTAQDFQVLMSNSRLPLLILVATIMLMLIFSCVKNKYIAAVTCILLLVVTTIDLLRFSVKFTPFTQQEYVYPMTRTLSFLTTHTGIQRIMSTDSQILPPNFSAMYHLQSIEGYDPLYLKSYGELVAATERGRPDITAPFGFNRIITPHRVDTPLIDLLGVKYVLSLQELHDPKLHQVFQEEHTRVYENTKAFPRAFFVTKVESVEGKENELIPYFSSSFDFHTHAVVAADEVNPLPQTSFPIDGKITATMSTNATVLTAHTSADSFLVITNVYYPTWHVVAYNNEEKRILPIYRTDYVFEGVIVPKGDWKITIDQSLF